ncbi:hypothetical protein [Acidocella sp.]|jgi:hypothetical protein|uniref:hypothetical protein n=1 Tax=Acidocella sp. TaxID=50710 RepID=UPI002F3F6B11
MAFVVLGPAILLACSQPKSIPDVGANSHISAPIHAFSLDTPLHQIAENKQGKAILVHDLPGLMASRSYILFDDMSLSQIAVMSGGRLTKAKLAVVEADLSNMPAAPGQ